MHTLIPPISCHQNLVHYLVSSFSHLLQYIFSRSEISTLLSHTLENEVILILIRFLSLLLVRDKQEKEKITDKKQPNIKSALFLTTKALLTHTNCIGFCLCLLKEMISRSHSIESEKKALKSDYIVPKYTKLSCSDFVPFFVKQFSKDKGDIFEDYPRLLIETIMRFVKFNRIPLSIHCSFTFTSIN